MGRGVGRIVKRVWKVVGGHRRYVGLDAKGRWKFLKHPGKSKSRTRKSKTKSKKRRRTNLGKRKKRRGGKSLQRTVFKWLRIGALVGPAVEGVLRYSDNKDRAEVILRRYTGYSMAANEFRLDWLAKGWMPFIGATLMTYGIPKLAGIIRRL